jgi:MoxR-like ATPase
MRKTLTPKLGIQGLENLDAAILAALAANATVLLIGPHGCAKTLLARRVAEALGCDFRHYNTSLLNYDDLVGYPIPDQDTAHCTSSRRRERSGMPNSSCLTRSHARGPRYRTKSFPSFTSIGCRGSTSSA